MSDAYLASDLVFYSPISVMYGLEKTRLHPYQTEQDKRLLLDLGVTPRQCIHVNRMSIAEVVDRIPFGVPGNCDVYVNREQADWETTIEPNDTIEFREATARYGAAAIQNSCDSTETSTARMHGGCRENELLDVRSAAEFLGMAVKTLRKLIERSRRRQEGIAVKGSTIRFLQDRRGSPILFRREFLDEFLENTTIAPEETPLMTKAEVGRPRKSQNRPIVADGEHINFEYLD